jgi:Ni/Co efflux regulator RcnB
MKLPRILITGAGVLLLGITPLLQAAPGPDGRGPGNGNDNGPGQPHQQQGGPGAGHDNRGDQQSNRGGNRPPQDFGPVRQTIQNNRDSFARGNPPPPNVRIERGRPLPQGYGHRLDARALQHLPRYDGYEWRRVGTDVVLIAIGTGLVYEILDNVLN